MARGGAAHPVGDTGPPRAQPSPRVLTLAAIKAADPSACGVCRYYGGDGLMAATAKQRALSGMDGGSRQVGATASTRAVVVVVGRLCGVGGVVRWVGG